jgi:hypothetical protein
MKLDAYRGPTPPNCATSIVRGGAQPDLDDRNVAEAARVSAGRNAIADGRAFRADEDPSSNRADGTAIDWDHCAGDVGSGRGEEKRCGSAELFGLSVPAQRDELRLTGTHVVGIAT